MPRLPDGQVVVASATGREVGGEELELARPTPFPALGHPVHGHGHGAWAGRLARVGLDRSDEGYGFGFG